jgi:uncharacterized protein (DUF885 family)
MFRSRPSPKLLGSAILMLSLQGCHGDARRPALTPDAPRRAHETLHALLDAEWERELREHPTWASELGDARYGNQWNDVSLTAIARRQADERRALEALRRIDVRELSEADRLSYAAFFHKLNDAVNEQAFFLHLLPINQRGGVQSSDELADALRFDSVKAFEDWNARLRAFPAYVDQTLALLDEGARRGVTYPKIVMKRVTTQIERQIVDDPSQSPFFAPYTNHAPAASRVDPAVRARLAEEAKALLVSHVVPSFRKLRAFWVETYLPACKDEVGIWQVPNGAALYEHLVRSHTTTNLTPGEVHAIGLREVTRIRGAMEEVKTRAGFSGSLSEMFRDMRENKRFFYKTGTELLAAYRELSKRIDPLLVQVFRTLPRTPYGVSAIPESLAPDTTTAYYRPLAADGSRAGTYFVNLYRPESRPTWEMTALTLHESVPGHHLQIALASEQENLPMFRRHGDYTAFVEGWALYAESLGEEMGLYDDPYAKMGQLTYEMWRAVRLVVDTGIHHLRWTRDQAIAFFRDNTAKSELDIVNEIDRYIAWPGQALAYKIGELRIRELRRCREAELGSAFDLKAFHDAVLRSGPLPLDILTREVAPTCRPEPLK